MGNQSLKQEIVAIIPARGGSKGVPRKNIRSLGKKPLVAWSIEAALKSGIVDRVFVCTEDEEIAQVSKEWGAEVPFLRPGELAQDDSIVGDAVSWMSGRLILDLNISYTVCLTLYPTHPFRTKRMLQAAVDALTLRGADSFATVRRIPTPPGKFVSIAHNGFARPLAPPSSPHEHYRPYGLVVGRARPRTYGGHFAYPVSGVASLVDIDTPEDFLHAESVLAAGLYDYEA